MDFTFSEFAYIMAKQLCVLTCYTTHFISVSEGDEGNRAYSLTSPLVGCVRVCYDALTDTGAVDAFARQGYSYKTVIREKHIEIHLF